MATCTMYKSTGFTAVDLPYDKAALEKAALGGKLETTLDLIQLYKLPSVRVKALESQIQDVDYLLLSDGTRTAGYAVTGYTMAAMDTAVLMLAQDPGTSAGGWDKVIITSGMWERAYDDKGGETVIDGLLQLTELPKMWYMHDWASQEIGDGAEDCTQLIATTVSLAGVPDSNDKVAYTYDDTDGTVSYAWVPDPAPTPTMIKMRIHRDMVTSVGKENYELEAATWGYRIYDYGNEYVRAAVQRLRAYGYESAVIGAWRVPNRFLNLIESEQAEEGFYSLLVTKAAIADVSSFPFMNPGRLYLGTTETAQENADLIRHSDYYRIGLLSVPTGAKIEKRRNEITGNTFGVIDPRRGGAPYFILQGAPKPTEGILTEPLAYIAGEVQKNGIQGAAWDDIPIIYEGASGSAKNYMALYMSENFANANYERERESLAMNGILGMFGSLGGASASYSGTKEDAAPFYGMNEFRRGNGLSISGIDIGTAQRAGGTLLSTMEADELLQQQRYQASKTAMANYVSTNILVAPQVSTQTIEGLQQYFGNSALIYCMYPTAKDVDRWGAIAAMFGVACNRPADAQIVRPVKACYYKGSGIQADVETINPCPRAVREDIGDLLNIGVRLWVQHPIKLVAADWAERITK